LKRLFSILLTNAWRGLRRTGALPATAVILVSVTILIFIISNVAAVAFPHIFSQDLLKHSANSNKEHPINIFGSTQNSSQQPKRSDKKPKPVNDSDSEKKTTTAPTSTPNSESNSANVSSTNSNPIFVLTELQCVANQAATPPIYTIENAALKFPSALTADTNVELSVETSADLGTPPDPSTINLSQTSRTGLAKSTSVVFNQSGSSQPLVTAPAGANGMYSFWLVAKVNGSNVAQSAPITVPAASVTCP
jgi:hypothetical protein